MLDSCHSVGEMEDTASKKSKTKYPWNAAEAGMRQDLHQSGQDSLISAVNRSRDEVQLYYLTSLPATCWTSILSGESQSLLDLQAQGNPVPGNSGHA